MPRWLPLVLTATACGAPVYLPQEPPPLGRFEETGEDTGGTPDLPCSRQGTVAVVLEVDNRRATPVDLFWVDGSCAVLLYTTVPGGTVFPQPSADTHVWLVRDTATQAYAASIVLDTTPTQTLVVE
jgi:hypothetical protein